VDLNAFLPANPQSTWSTPRTTGIPASARCRSSC